MSEQKLIEQVYAPPPPHWVGDGFQVRGYFNLIPDGMRRLSPFLLLDYGPPTEFPPTDSLRRGVGPHPHRGFETITLAYQGSVAHGDSEGNSGVINPGDVQWMTAASGILHREYHDKAFARSGGTFQMAQLWVNLPAAHKMDAPRYQALAGDQMGKFEVKNGVVRVIAGEYDGVKGPAMTFSPIELYDIELRSAGKAEFTLPQTYNTAMLVVAGSAKVNGREVAENDFVLFKNEGKRIAVDTTGGARLLVLSGQPLDEPVANYGPFVMNTPDEIATAIRDFQTGKFGQLDE